MASPTHQVDVASPFKFLCEVYSVALGHELFLRQARSLHEGLVNHHPRVDIIRGV